MRKLTSVEIAEGAGGRLIAGSGNETATEAVIDSREAGPGKVFFAIIGQNHDAHDFLPQVVENGCLIAVISDESRAPVGCDVILVDDTLKALQALAKWYMARQDIKTVAVTGSVGKTSTRDLVYAGLSAGYRTAKNKKNFNNQFGVPLTVLSMSEDTEAAVIEMGMEHKGEIHNLADIVRPDVAVITNIGVSHMENLGSREGIMNAKLEVTDFFTEENTLVFHADDDMLQNLGETKYKKVRVGDGSGGDGDFSIIIENVTDKGALGVDVELTANGEPIEVSLKIPGAHNAKNLALALAACQLLGVDIRDAAKAMENAELTGNRLKVSFAGGITVIDDSYNAAPASMESAMKTLVATGAKRHIAVLGGMAELGPDSKALHEKTGEAAKSLGVDILVALGENAAHIAGGAEKAGMKNVLRYAERDDFYPDMKELFKDGDAVLIKGSRVMELEKVADKIHEIFD